MKKMIFSAVAVLAVVGSTFAFSGRSSDKLFCQDPAQGITTCTVQTQASFINRNQGLRNDIKCNTVSSSTCLTSQVYVGL